MTTTNVSNGARITRRRAQRLGLRLSQRGTVFTLTNGDGVTLAVGALGVVDAYLLAHARPRPPGPARSNHPPTRAWATLIDDYLLTLAAAGQSEGSIRLRCMQLCQMARGLACPPDMVSGDALIRWFGHQQHWAPESRSSYRAAARGFFRWAHRFGRLPTNPGLDVPKVRVPKDPPRPAADYAWCAALAHADARLVLALRLAGECGLRRAEIASVHTRDLVEVGGVAQLVVKGKGGKRRVIPVSDSLSELLRLGAAGHSPGMPARGWLFPNGVGGHLTPDRVGKLIARALPDDWTAHTLRHRMATRAYRGSRNLRAVQALLGHESILTTERYTAVDDAEIRAAAAYAW